MPTKESKEWSAMSRSASTIKDALFDGGANGGGFNESIMNLIDSLESRKMAIGTAIGIDQKEYSGAKLKVIRNRFQEEIIHNMNAIGFKNIETEKNNTD